MTSPIHPELYTPIRFWSPVNQGCYSRFRHWLQRAEYSQSALDIYSCAVRMAFSHLEKPYWQITDADLDAVRALIAANYESPTTRHGYHKGLRKLAEFLRTRQDQPQPEKSINWPHFLDGLPPWLVMAIRGYVRHRQRTWLPEEKRSLTSSLLSTLTLFLRWAVTQTVLVDATDLTPTLWFTYLDLRLTAGIAGKTTNRELHAVQGLVRYLSELEEPVCMKLLDVQRLQEAVPMPRDVPVAHLRSVAAEIERDAAAEHRGVRRTGIMDRAWFLLMLHCGLRPGEVRRLRLPDMALSDRRVRIEQSKGLKDRVVFLSEATVAAIETYLPFRGPSVTEHLFVYHHRSLTVTYFAQRLRTFGKRCGVTIRPHQLRHSCATLLLNAGAPVLTVQTLLGHKHVDTTMGYARLYNGTVAADYYRAMVGVEQRLQLTPTTQQQPQTPGQLIALVDALGDGTLTEQQRQVAHELRLGLLTLAEQLDGVDAVAPEGVPV